MKVLRAFLFLSFPGVSVHAQLRSGLLWTPDRGTIDIGSLGPDTAALDVNNNGQVVGFSGGHAFSWTESGGIVALQTNTNAPSEARGINNAGQIVGYADGRPALWEADGTLHYLGDSDWFRGYAINDDGMAVGEAYSLAAWAWTELSDISILANGIRAADVNNSGQVVGGVNVGGNWTPALWDDTSGWKALGALPGESAAGLSLGINDHGAVVGVTDWIGPGASAFLWTEANGMRDLGHFGGLNMLAQDINNAGMVVGWGTDGGETDADRVAFVWTEAGGLVKLLDTPSEAYAVNNNGWIVGVQRAPNRVPEGGHSLVLLGGAIAMISTFYRPSRSQPTPKLSRARTV